MIDKKSVIIGIFAGMLIGIVTSVFLASILINSIGESFKVENMNITVSMNDSIIKDTVKNIEKKQNIAVAPKENIDLKKEYDKGFFDGLKYYQSHILSSGSTFEYDKGRYVIKAVDILPYKVELEILQNGSEIFNGTCYKNKMCNIKDVSFQIDDIHIGNEASYLVYWSDK